MRKADYTALAAIIRARLTAAESTHVSATDDKARAQAQGRAEACAAIAIEFADRASVNRAEFLKACGIEP